MPGSVEQELAAVRRLPTGHWGSFAMPSTLTIEQIMKLPILEVRTSTAVDAFIGFTVMPKASRGKRYRLDEDMPWVVVDPEA